MSTIARRLLIVEDDEPTRRAVRGLFARMEWTVRAADSIADGLAVLEGDPPDVLILDLMLRDGRGESLIEHVRDRGLKTRVIVLSGVISQSRLLALAELKPTAVLPKSLTLPEIWDGLVRACEGIGTNEWDAFAEI
jgi:DNA-binding NtrC family response regulator